MAVYLSPVGGVAAQFFDNDGNVLSGGKIYTYGAGSSTPVVTYTTASGSIPHSNPIILDSAGRVPSGEIWLTDGISYKFVLNNSNDVLIGTYDNIIGINSNFSNFIALQDIQTATAGQTVFTLANAYVPGANTLSVFVDGVNQYDGVSYSYVETNSNTVTFASGLHVGALVKFTTVQTLTTTQATTAGLVTYTPAGTGAVSTTVQTKLRQWISPEDYGAVGDANEITDASINAGSNVLTTATGHFVASDVGKRISVWGAGSGNYSLVATIATFTSSSSITLSTNASTSVSGVVAQYGTDDWQALQNAVTYLYSLGGGTLKAPRNYFICRGVNGNSEFNQFNCAFQYCSNINFDFSGGGVYGTLSFNTNNGAATVKTYNTEVINGTFRAVGDRVEAPNSSTEWNVITFIYAENIKVSGVNIFVPPGARAISFQSDSAVGTDATKLKNIIFDDFIINGPPTASLQYLSDGIDLLTGDADGIYDSINISNGIISNVGRGFATQNPGGTGTYKNNMLMLSNLQFLDVRVTGMHIADVFGLMIDNVRIVAKPDTASSYVYEGRGFTSYNCVTLGNINNLSVLGVDLTGLQVAVAISKVGSATAEYTFSDLYVGVDGVVYKWANGLSLNVSDCSINNALLANCTIGMDSSATQRNAINGLITRDNTTDFGTQAVLDRRSGKLNVSNYRDFDSGQNPAPVSFDGIVASGRLRYSTVPIGSVAYGSMGTDSVQVAGTLYVADMAIPRAMTITGIGVLNGSTVGTDKVIYGLYADTGVLLASTALAGTTTSGANAFQQIALTAPIFVRGPARFAIVVQYNGTTDKMRKIAANTFIDVMTQDEVGVFGTIQSVSYDNTFTADIGPIAYVY